MTRILETSRLILRELGADDADFILELVNDADWLRHIGDRHIRNLADAHRYIEEGPRTSYQAHGHGLWVATLKGGGQPIGLCGFLKRDVLDNADLGYALLPAFRARGYALEACAAALEYAGQTLAFSRVLAIVSPANHRSIRLLEKLGFRFLRSFSFDADNDNSYLYERALN